MIKGRKRPFLPDNTRKALLSQYENLRVINGVVYQETEDQQTHLKYLLPAHITERVLTALHSTVYGAHLGRKKTKAKTERFYRPFLVSEIEQLVRSCDTCQKTKTLVPRTRAEMIL